MALILPVRAMSWWQSGRRVLHVVAIRQWRRRRGNRGRLSSHKWMLTAAMYSFPYMYIWGKSGLTYLCIMAWRNRSTAVFGGLRLPSWAAMLPGRGRGRESQLLERGRCDLMVGLRLPGAVPVVGEAMKVDNVGMAEADLEERWPGRWGRRGGAGAIWVAGWAWGCGGGGCCCRSSSCDALLRSESRRFSGTLGSRRKSTLVAPKASLDVKGLVRG